MKHKILCGLAVLLLGSAAFADGPPAETSLYKRFDAVLSSKDQIDWLKLTSAEPNQVGSPHDKSNADWILAHFKKWGWDAHIETFQVLFPTPISEAVEMGSFKATLQEKPIPGDTSSTAKDYALPAYLAYQGDGDVTAPLVYVNYGTQADYKQLALMGVSVKGKIVIARYGEVWRGVKPLLAYKHGAIGCIIYSDPADDGYAEDAVYPKGPMRPPQGIQRGSAMDMMLYPGDPLTPGVGATAGAKRLTPKTAGSVLKIPALPISYADAQVLLAAIKGPVAPRNWRGALPITYRVGAGGPNVQLEVKSNWDLKPAYDVIATIKGSTFPDEWVVRGNHHDGWVEGASDPLSGQVALLDEAKAIGALVKSGWKPKRSIVYTSWDGEEPMLLGSTEWVEQHADELKKKAVLYINTDGNSRGFMRASGNQDLGGFVTGVADSVTDPEAHVSLAARSRDKLLTMAASPGASPDIKAEAKEASAPGSDLPVGAAGSGSDFSPFLDHLGVTTLNIGFGGEAHGGGVYHSRYDTFEHHIRFDDPGLVYGKVLSEMVGHAVLAAADSDLPLQHPADFARAMSQDVSMVERIADTERMAAAEQKKLIAANAYAIAADPTEPHGNPVPVQAVPAFDFKPLDEAAATLTKSAKAYESAVAAHGTGASPAQIAKLQEIMQTIDQTLLSEAGLPGRPWYKNLVYAPGRYIGYGVTTLPGITEAITEERWSDVPKYVQLTARAFDAYAARLNAATAALSGS
ncbi:MAG TPA: transferrin receptor-like dimerization domain-containing protein [Rhizomicrobium sp.]|jgi:N-acetylated-alpha-linked acidic dipeptidase|nr:transferrin receptor-like dimerization domain-containing protein [Rhizomicrobium sp.]